MIGAWMARAVVASGLVALAALAFERVLESFGRPRRTAWIAGIVGSLLLPLLAVGVAAVWPASRWMNTRPGLEPSGAMSFDGLAAAAPGWVSADRVLGAAWLVAALVALCVYLAGWARLAAARRGWRRERVADEAVLVAPATGPAAVGVLRPAIVVPEWLLLLDERVQRLVVLHESEHLSARDHVLLGLAPILFVIAPWNPAFWYMVRRLRLAIEMDCDRRVLSRGVEAEAYGTLLIDVAGKALPIRFSTAFAAPRSSLERRIIELTSVDRRRAAGRGVLFGVGAMVLVLVASAAAPPFGSRPAAFDERHAWHSASDLSLAGDRYEIDGRPATEAEFRALDRSTVAHVEVARFQRVRQDGSVEASSSTVTRAYTQSYAETHDIEPARRSVPRERIDGLLAELRRTGAAVFIDDRPSTMDALDAVDASRIESLRVQQVNERGGRPRSEVRVRTRPVTTQ